MGTGRGAAVLDGADFNSEPIVSLTQEIEALGEAEGEAARRARKAAQEARQRALAEIRSRVQENEQRRLAALSESERACQALVKSIMDGLEAGEQINADLRLLGLRPVISLADRDRLSRYVTAVLRPLIRYDRTFGLIRFPEPRDADRGSWRDREERMGEQEINRAKGQTDE